MRPLRQKTTGAYYHVSATTIRSETCLDEVAKSQFLEIVARAKLRYSFQLINFCVMGNHFHFLIRPEEGVDLSRIMQWILSRYARAFNKARGFRGHLWMDRFYSRILKSVQDYWNVIRYVDENPKAAGLVKGDQIWPFSGLFHALKGIKTVLENPTEELIHYWRSLVPQ